MLKKTYHPRFHSGSQRVNKSGAFRFVVKIIVISLCTTILLGELSSVSDGVIKLREFLCVMFPMVVLSYVVNGAFFCKTYS